MHEVLRKLNWVDVSAILLVLRMCYIAVSRRLPTEIFKLLGTILAVYLSLHYYTVFGAYMRGKVGQTEIRGDFFDLAAFGTLVACGYFVFALLRKVFIRGAAEEPGSFVERPAAIVLGLCRGILAVSLILYIFSISGVDYLKKSAAESYTGRYCLKAGEAVYDFLWNNAGSKFSGSETHNSAVNQVTGQGSQT